MGHADLFSVKGSFNQTIFDFNFDNFALNSKIACIGEHKHVPENETHVLLFQ